MVFLIIIIYGILFIKIDTIENNNTNIIILRFKTYNSNIINNSEFTIKDFKEYLFSNIYFELEIGDEIDYIKGTNQTLNTNIDTKTNSLKLIHIKNDNKFCNYNSSLSNSFKSIVINSLNCQAEEKIKLYNDINLTKYSYKYLIFDNYNCLNDSLCGVAGINIYYSYGSKETSFISQLHNILNTSEQSWSFIYANEEGIFIFGDMPHNYLSKKYNENNLISFYSKSTNYEITMDSIIFEYNNKSLIDLGDNNDYINLVISPDIEGIECGNYYFNIIYKLFYYYIDKKICQTEIIDLTITIIYCDGNYFQKKDIDNFPKLIFNKYKLDFNISFENYELFYYKDNKYFFKIYKRFGEDKKFTLGRILLKKYLTIFNTDKKQIYFYKNIKNTDDNDYNNIKKENNIYKEWWIILLFFIVMIIFLLIGILIGKILYKGRKKHANEMLDDNYEYKTNKDNINEPLYQSID